MSVHGAALSTLINKAHGVATTLLIVEDRRGAIFGALITEALRFGDRDKYYGNGTIGVWSFNTRNNAQGSKDTPQNGLKYYPWSYRNSYFLISSSTCLGLGGGGQFALYLDEDLRGSSGACQTFNSPCLASNEEFQVRQIELYALQTPKV
jgi:hypothetical protein